MFRQRFLHNSFSFMRGNILVLTITGAIGMLCRSMVFPYASLYILSLGGQPAQIGLINSLGPLAGLLVFPIAGYLTDAAGRVKLISLAGYLSGLVLLLYIFAPNWQWIALGSLLQGFMVFQFPPSSAIIADSLSPRTRARGMATMFTIAGALAMISPYAAGATLEKLGVTLGMRWLYAVMALTSFISATINLRFLEETSDPGTRHHLSLSNLWATLKEAYRSISPTLKALPAPLRAMTIIISLGFMTNAIAGPYWVVYAIKEIGLSPVQWGLILLVETATRNVAYIPAGLLADRYGQRRFMLPAMVVALAGVGLFTLSSTFVDVLLIRVAIGASNAFFAPASSALVADSVPREMRGRVMAIIGRGSVMVGTSGGTGGPGVGLLVTAPLVIASACGGYLYTAQTSYPWIFASAATIVSIAILALYVREPKHVHL